VSAIRNPFVRNGFIFVVVFVGGIVGWYIS
jgi:hypothetical protein